MTGVLKYEKKQTCLLVCDLLFEVSLYVSLWSCHSNCHFPMFFSAIRASSGSSTHTTHTILNHTRKHILLIPSQIQGLLRPYFITHTPFMKWATVHGYRSTSLHFFFFRFPFLWERLILLENFLHTYIEKACRYNRDIGHNVQAQSPLVCWSLVDKTKSVLCIQIQPQSQLFLNFSLSTKPFI